MLTLYRTACNTDWKGRPDHDLRILGASEDREELIALQNADVLKWQREDIERDREMAQEAAELGEPFREIPDVLEAAGERWEMEISGDLREFAWRSVEETFSSIVYHILDEDGRCPLKRPRS